MLEQIRKNSRSFIIWILFGIIIAVFIISFGPQADQQIGCGKSKSYVLQVKGEGVSVYSWRYGNTGLPLAGMSKQARAEIVMDLLLQRELLAQAAENAGFNFTNDQVARKVAAGEFYVLGYPQDGKQIYYRDGYFDDEYLDRVVRNLGLPNTKYFIKEQRRELLAAHMRSLLTGGVQVSRDELMARFRHENTKVSLDYVKFNPSTYRTGLLLTSKQVAAYLSSHEAEVKKKYEDDKPRYKDRGKEVRARHIFLKKSPPKPKPPQIRGKDGAKKDSAKPAGDKKAPTEAIDPQQTKLEGLRAQIVGGKDFASVAKAHSEDERSAFKGGDLGWRPIKSIGWGKELSEAAEHLEKGKLSEVIETPRGFHVLRIEETREGTLSFDQVKMELAERMAADHYAKKAAQADANKALAQLEAGKKLEEMFERRAKSPGLPGGITPEQLKNLPPELREKLMRQLLQGNQSGSIVREGPNVPAEWTSWDQAPGAGAGAPGKAKPKAKPGGKVRVEPGGKVKVTPGGKVKIKPAGGTKPKAGGDKPKPSFKPADDGIPRPSKLEMPPLETSRMFTRLPDQLPGVGKSAKAVALVFEELEKGEHSKVLEIEGSFVILQVVDREDPDMESFAKQESALRQRYLESKGLETVKLWVRARCTEAVEKKQVSFSKSALEFQDDKGKTLPITYRPCQAMNLQ